MVRCPVCKGQVRYVGEEDYPNSYICYRCNKCLVIKPKGEEENEN